MNLRSASLLTAAAVTTAGLFSAAGCELIAIPDRSLIPDGVGTGLGGSGGTGGEPTTSSAGGAGGQGGTGGAGTGGQGGTGGEGTGGQGGTGGEGTGGGGTGGAGTGGGGTGGAGTGGQGGAGQGGAGQGGAGQGGSGGSSMCTQPVDCVPTANECVTATCIGGVCGTANVDAGTVTAAQTPGDCKVAVCDGSGAIASQNDDNDNDDGQDCTTDSCAAGAPVHTPVALGVTCDDGGGKVCTATGTCVECNITQDCTGGATCQANICAPASCTDLTQNGDETGIDCGGSCPTDCADGGGCLVNGDCVSTFCHPTTMVCTAPACDDGFTNGSETDTDCGGSCVTDCANGETCVTGLDCVSTFCHPTTTTCTAPTCSDGYQNQGETGVDCGGPCGACNNEACVANANCASGMCYEALCVASVNGCDINTATDMGSAATITFANGNFTYAPKCIRVTANAVVTFSGNFTSHPLQGGQVVAGAAVPQTTGPFGTRTNTGTTMPFTMATAGTFPYYCEPHAVSRAMTGAIFVVTATP